MNEQKDGAANALNRRDLLKVGTSLAAATMVPALAKAATSKPPNVVVIFGDDIGYWNVGVYTHNMMGATPHIETNRRAAKSSITTRPT